jgi:hypothetical protein
MSLLPCHDHSRLHVLQCLSEADCLEDAQ